MKKILKFLLLYSVALCIGVTVMYLVFRPIFCAKKIVFPYAIHPFDICKVYPYTWKTLKKAYIICFVIVYNIFLIKILKKVKLKIRKSQNIRNEILNEYELNDEICLIVGTNDKNEYIKISEEGLYQNIFITGTIGSGKTSSAMYPFTSQLIEYKAVNTKEKIAMLILDVKGNYSEKVLEFSKNADRLKDVYVIDLSSNIKYNPLDKPELTPTVLANRLKTILELFNKQSSESYWLDKAEQVLAESIKFCRIYNDGYVNFIELHKVIMFPDYYTSKVKIARKKFEEGLLKEEDIYNLLSCVNFFDKEFFSLDDRTLSILKSEISRITNIFVSDYDVSKTFCPKKEEINFRGFEEVLDLRKNSCTKYEYFGI